MIGVEALVFIALIACHVLGLEFGFGYRDYVCFVDGLVWVI